MINLLAPEMKRQIRAARLNVTLLNYCVLLGFTALLLVVIFGIGFWLTMQERAGAENKKAQSQQLVAQHGETKKIAENFANDLKQAKAILGSQLSFYNLVAKIAEVVPGGVILNNLALGTSSLNAPVNISAKARNYDDAVKLKNNLANSPIFENVNLVNVSSTPQDAVRDPVGVRYPITITISATFSQEFIASAGAKP